MSRAGGVGPGVLIDGFAVGERLHAGGMGALYRVSVAGGPGPGFPLLMKVPRLGHGEPAESLISFEVEQMVLAALKGPHVPRFVAAGDLTRQPYLVMELIEGRSLKEWVGSGPVPPAEVARLGAALATALHSVHLQEAIHLDLKPSNVMFRASGEAVLIDFGLAHHAHFPDLLAEELRRPIGSAPYISPEQVVGVRNDPRSDIFSLGALLYELATGELPFGSPGASGLRKRLYRDPTPPRALVPTLPPWLQEVVLHCLEPDGTHRYASAAQVAFDLAYPDQVAVGERGERTRAASGATVLRRWVRATGFEPAPLTRPSAQVTRAAIVLVAVATQHSNEELFQALREAVQRLLSGEEHTRLACATVIRPSSDLGGTSEEETATGQRLKHLALLRHWAEELALPRARLSFHVLESADPAAALLEYARANKVDHLVIGAPPPGLPLKALVGTVATRVAADAPRTVTLVRPRLAGR